MAVGLLLEFDGVGVEQYDAVNERLQIDMSTGPGDWPEGLLFHAGGAKPGGWVVMEVGASQDDQQRFMEARLGRALQEGGVTDPPTAWSGSTSRPTITWAGSGLSRLER